MFKRTIIFVSCAAVLGASAALAAPPPNGADREVPRLVVPELNDIRVGDFEGKLLTEYRAWARKHDPTAEPPGGGESRAATVRRFLRGYRIVLDRPEPTILVVAHGLPIRYLLNAVSRVDPAPVVEQVAYAVPFKVSATELTDAITRLEAWSATPAWRT